MWPEAFVVTQLPSQLCPVGQRLAAVWSLRSLLAMGMAHSMWEPPPPLWPWAPALAPCPMMRGAVHRWVGGREVTDGAHFHSVLGASWDSGPGRGRWLRWLVWVWRDRGATVASGGRDSQLWTGRRDDWQGQGRTLMKRVTRMASIPSYPLPWPLYV